MANVDSNSSLEDSFLKNYSRNVLSTSTNSNNSSLNDTNISINNTKNLTDNSDCLKISIINKSSRASGEFRKVTIGPNADQENQNLITYVTSSSRNVSNNAIAVCEKKIDGSKLQFSHLKILHESKIHLNENSKKRIEQKVKESNMVTEACKSNRNEQLQVLSEERERLNAEKLVRLEEKEEMLAQQEETNRLHEREKRKEQENKEIWKIIEPCRKLFHAKLQDIICLSKDCQNKDKSVEIFSPYLDELKELSMGMESIYEKSRNNDLTSADMKNAEVIFQRIDEIFNELKRQIEISNLLLREEIAKRNIADLQAKKEQRARENLIERHQQLAGNDTVVQQPQEPQVEVVDVIDSKDKSIIYNTTQETQSSRVSAVATTGQTSNVEASKESVKRESDPYPDPKSVDLYIESRQFLEKFLMELQNFVQSPATKELKFSCQKAISVPINTISKMTGSQLTEKYESLKLLLLGKSKPNILSHPRGGDFCKNSIAMKFLEQGENNIAIKPETAFPFAAVIVALWNDFPDFGKLFMSQLWAKSPFFVPVFFSLKEGQPIETYYRLLGCKFNENGTPEESDKFLKRLSGLMYLYASIIVTKQRKGCNKPHPHGLANGWRWLTATINIEPKLDTVDICATLICNFLEVTGSDMYNTFPRQFSKLLQVLRNDYFPKLKNASPTGSGPLSRLEDFLNNAVTHSIPPPKGQLPLCYW